VLLQIKALPAQNISNINVLNTKRNLLYMRNQSVPRCKHFTLRL